MTIMNESSLYFKWGELSAIFLLSGILHPDLTLNNLGFKENNVLTTYDYGDIEFFKFPEELLNKEIIRKLTESILASIMSITENTDEKFKAINLFRCGYISKGGNLAHLLFNNTINNGVYSFKFLNISKKLKKYNFKLTQNDLNLICEWKYFNNTESFKNIDIKKISEKNRYYLNFRYLILYYYYFYFKNDILNINVILMNMIILAYNQGKGLIAYGILLKYMKNKKRNTFIANSSFQKVICEIQSEYSYLKNEIRKFLEYDMSEFLWILNDISIEIDNM